jgi:hypothetical protein
MSTGLATQMLDLASATMRDRHRDARERATRVAARRGRVRGAALRRNR